MTDSKPLEILKSALLLERRGQAFYALSRVEREVTEAAWNDNRFGPL